MGIVVCVDSVLVLLPSLFRRPRRPSTSRRRAEPPACPSAARATGCPTRHARRLHRADRSCRRRARHPHRSCADTPDDADLVLVDDGGASRLRPRGARRRDRRRGGAPDLIVGLGARSGPRRLPHLRALARARAEAAAAPCLRQRKLGGRSTAARPIIRIDRIALTRRQPSRGVFAANPRAGRQSQASQAKILRPQGQASMAPLCPR